MKLEPKHLAPYLPFDLDVVCLDKGVTFFNQQISIHSFRFSKNFVHNTYQLIYRGEGVCMENIKPILYPLSDFKEEQIEEIKAFLNHKWCQVYDEFFDALFEHDWLMHTRILMCPYEIIQWFFKNHYDVFGLIEDDLAIDINTLNK
jgi:hypothetical protein